MDQLNLPLVGGKNIKHLSWEVITQLVDDLVEPIKEFAPQQLIPIARGGLVPAVMLSHMLDIPICRMITTTDKYTLSTLTFDEVADVLFIDDILDTGRTMQTLYNHYKHLQADVKFAVLVSKPTGVACIGNELLITPAPLQVSDDTWIEFPWEV